MCVCVFFLFLSSSPDFHHIENNHSAFIGLDCAVRSLWYWLLFAGYSINFSVIQCWDRNSHICMPFGMCWFSSHRILHAYCLHIMQSKRNMQIVYQISVIGRSTNLSWVFHLFPSNAITVRKNAIYNSKMKHMPKTMCEIIDSVDTVDKIKLQFQFVFLIIKKITFKLTKKLKKNKTKMHWKTWRAVVIRL